MDRQDTPNKKRNIDWKSVIPEDDENSSGSEYNPSDTCSSDESECDAGFQNSEKSLNTRTSRKKLFTEQINLETKRINSDNYTKKSLLKTFSSADQVPKKVHNQDSEPTITFPKTTTESSKIGRKSLLKQIYTVPIPEKEGFMNSNDDIDKNNNTKMIYEKKNEEESRVPEPPASNFCSSSFVEKTASASAPKSHVTSLKRKRNRIEDFDFPTQTVGFSDEGGKYYYKLNCCCFCYSLELRVDRHYKSHHPEEKEVQILIHCKSAEERRAKYKELRLRGNDFFNNDKTLNPKGIIISSRRISRKKIIGKRLLQTENRILSIDGTSAKPESTIRSSISSTTDSNAHTISGVFKFKCSVCSMWVAPSNLRNHNRLAHPDNGNLNSRQLLKEAKRCMLYVHPDADPRVIDHIFAKIRDPVISALVRHDTLIVLFANKFADKFTTSKQLNMVRNYVLLIAKFMLEMKKLSPEIKDFKMIFQTQYWKKVVKAIRNVSDFNEYRKRFGIPYNAETLPLLLRKCFKILRHYLVTIKDSENIQNLNDFIAFFRDDIQNEILIMAYLSRKEMNRHTNDKSLPSSNDIVTFREYLDLHRKQILDELKTTKMTYEHYYTIMACTALLIEIFNRRRNQEVGGALLEDFYAIKKADEKSEFFQQLTEEEKRERLAILRMDVLGKRFDGKGSLYMDEFDHHCLKTVLPHRKSFHISSNNPFLFAVRSGRDKEDKYIDTYDAMCTFTKKCNDEYKTIQHELIRSTALRKHAATVNGIIEDGKNTTRCAELLGHSERIQKSKYKRIVDRQDVDNVTFLKRINSTNYGCQSTKPLLPNLDSSYEDLEHSRASNGNVKFWIK